jgi:hypothetical protein
MLMERIVLSREELVALRTEDQIFLSERGLPPVFAMKIAASWYSCNFLPLQAGTMRLSDQWEWPIPPHFRDLFLLGICALEGGVTSFIGLDAATGRVDVVDYENDDVTYLYQPLAGSLASMDAVFTALSAAVREAPLTGARLAEIVGRHEPDPVSWHDLAEDLAGDDGEITTAGIYAADPQRFADWSMIRRG